MQDKKILESKWLGQRYILTIFFLLAIDQLLSEHVVPIHIPHNSIWVFISFITI